MMLLLPLVSGCSLSEKTLLSAYLPANSSLTSPIAGMYATSWKDSRSPCDPQPCQRPEDSALGLLLLSTSPRHWNCLGKDSTGVRPAPSVRHSAHNMCEGAFRTFQKMPRHILQKQPKSQHALYEQKWRQSQVPRARTHLPTL